MSWRSGWSASSGLDGEATSKLARRAPQSGRTEGGGKSLAGPLYSALVEGTAVGQVGRRALAGATLARRWLRLEMSLN